MPAPIGMRPRLMPINTARSADAAPVRAVGSKKPAAAAVKPEPKPAVASNETRANERKILAASTGVGLGGAVAGFMVAGPVGAVVGGLLTGGLFAFCLKRPITDGIE